MSADGKLVGVRTLYSQVRGELVRRLEDRTWGPGMMLPSEIELAREFGVSQGTVRKALNELTAENLLTRRQGRGTFVAQPEDARILFQFFRLVPDDEAASFPVSRFLSREAGAATADEALAIEIEPGDDVWRIQRDRAFGAALILSETVILPRARFPDLPDLADLPNNIYQLFSMRWGVTIAQAEEKLKAVSADAETASRLGCAPGAALLRIRRVARDLGGRAVELRISSCLTDRIHYAVSLR
jgi:GntR family transcriptional regulator